MKPYRILIVDDDKDIRELMVEFLEDEGFITNQAENAGNAFLCIEHNKPDLVLLDIEMPGGNGLDVCRTMKSKPSTADIPVIIVSGSDTHDNIMSAYCAGAWLFMRKPFTLGKLGDSIKDVLYVPLPSKPAHRISPVTSIMALPKAV